MQLQPCAFPPQAARLPTVTTIRVPEGYNWKEITDFLMDKHSIEIAGGLGPTAGKVGSALPFPKPTQGCGHQQCNTKLIQGCASCCLCSNTPCHVELHIIE